MSKDERYRYRRPGEVSPPVYVVTLAVTVGTNYREFALVLEKRSVIRPTSRGMMRTSISILLCSHHRICFGRGRCSIHISCCAWLPSFMLKIDSARGIRLWCFLPPLLVMLSLVTLVTKGKRVVFSPCEQVQDMMLLIKSPSIRASNT